MEQITIGLDLAKHVFQVHGVDQEGKSSFVDGCDERRSSGSSRRCHPASWASRPARLRTTGRGSSSGLGMRCG